MIRKLNVGLFLACFLSLGMGTILQGAEPTPASKSGQELTEQLKTFGKAFGVEAPVSQTLAPPTNTESQTGKTVADVADRALDMVKDTTAKLAKTLSDIAPDVWRIMLRQQYSKAVGGVSTPVVLLIVLAIWYKLGKKQKPTCPEEHEGDNFTVGDGKWTFYYVVCVFIPIVISIITSVYLAFCATDSIKILINPEFYAIQDLLTVLLKGGTVS